MHAEAYGASSSAKPRAAACSTRPARLQTGLHDKRDLSDVLSEAQRAVKAVGAGRSADTLQPSRDVAADTWARIGDPPRAWKGPVLTHPWPLQRAASAGASSGRRAIS